MIHSNQTIQFDLKRRIMRRVYAVWFWKSVAPLLAAEAVLLAGVAAAVLTQISVRDIMLNALQASSGIATFAKFFAANFFIKSLQSRLLVAVYFAFAGFFARDVWNAVRRLRGADAFSPAALAFGNRRGRTAVL